MWEIDLIPTFVHGDAELNLRFASAFYDNPNRDWLAPTYSLMPLYFALNGLGTFLFGFTVLGARASDVLLGILALVFLFDGLRRVANLWLAVVGTLLTAVNHTHVAFSRVGTGNIQTTCVVAMVFAIFSRVWTAPTYFNAVLLGLAVVIGIQTYQASYAALPLLLAVILVLAVFNPQRRRALVVPTCLFLLTIASIGSPVAVAMVRHRGELVARAHIVSLLYPETFQHVKQDIYHTDSNTAVIAQQAWLALLGFHRGHDYEAQYGASVPMADPYTAALMVPGVVLALCGLRQFAAATTVIFTVGYLLLGLGTSVSPGFNRATGALALGPVLAAIALVRCTDPLTGIGTLGRYLRGLFLGAVVTFILTVNLQIYLPRARSATDIESAAGRLAQKYADHYHVHLVSWPLGLPGNDGLRLIVGRLPIDLHRETDPVAYVEHLNLSGQNLLIIHGAQAAARDAARQRFPGARVEVWPRPEVPTLFLMFVDADGRG
ncbi:MAG TPA: glycosyltransferase family 39 protein [Candidatus Kryptonia bacterium]|nr:glycosyltransferase family 39 protein [Candidatus Kryptonia bacterium]